MKSPKTGHAATASSAASTGPCILAAGERVELETLAQLRTRGFDYILLSYEGSVADAHTLLTGKEGFALPPLIRLRLDRFDLADPLVESYPDAFAIKREASDEGPVDPRRPATVAGSARARLRRDDLPADIGSAIEKALLSLIEKGARGFVIDTPDARACGFYRSLFERLLKASSELVLIAATPGLPREDAKTLAGCGFDFFISSVSWWDMRARWLLDEHAELSPLLPLVAEVTPTAASRAAGPEAAAQLLTVAAATGSGMIVPERLLAREEAVDAALRVAALGNRFSGELTALTGPDSDVQGFMRGAGPTVAESEEALFLLLNTSADEVALDPYSSMLAGSQLQRVERLSGRGSPFALMAPHEARVLLAKRAEPISRTPTAPKKSAREAADADRIVVENLSPSVSGGDFPVKRVVGDRVDVTADIYMDGHEEVAAELLWRAETDRKWRAVRMQPEGNDVWSAAFTLDRLGAYEFTVEAWQDRFGHYRHGLAKKREAGVCERVDLDEGRALIESAQKKAGAKLKPRLKDALAAYDAAEHDDARGEFLLSPSLAVLMDEADERRHGVRAEPQRTDAERLAARFSSWYELFPRSMTDRKDRHGTLRDVIDHLPRVAEMGFDTLYFPPIHPIGEANRKGPNNTLTPEPGDPGSPYAIGSKDGGHDAIHPELGGFDDFRALVTAAKAHGLEIALDFAIQCSPDHPWLKEHPGWFAWRPDGSMKYAENPPKKYQDIVNVDFYGPDSVPDLWIALKDVILLWVQEGVKTFRVDNPHTKPLPFWEWMIREVRMAHPEVIFLSEAFTRPKVMYRLAKAGFSQSYTYFTWRNGKQELTEYIEELTTEAPKEFFRPHFFVNTPDINPVFLQTGGRPAHRIRAVLAATLSGLWGVYSGFELCDATPLAGKEEYLDSEKYEVRPRDWRTPGDIVDDVTMLNRLRRGYPALQTHLNTRFYAAHNDNIIYYGKPSPDGGDMILVAVNLDPHGAHGCDFEVPLWEFGIGDNGAVAVEDLVSGERFAWHGKVQQLHLSPDEPYRIWRIAPEKRNG